jgi:hypothetical protein
MNGARRDEHWDNLALAHHKCNSEKGSRRIPEHEANAVQQNSPSDISGGIDDANCEGRGSDGVLRFESARARWDPTEG